MQARAEDAPPQPAIVAGKAWAPVFAEVQRVSLQKREIELVSTSYVPVRETSSRTEIINGRAHEIPVTTLRYVPETRISLRTFVALRAVRPSGEEIREEALTKAIGDGAVVVLSTDPQGNISKDVARLLAKDAILLLAVPGPPAPGPKLGEPGFDPYSLSPAGRINAPPSLAPPPPGK
jgi:hypothetical protein